MAITYAIQFHYIYPDLNQVIRQCGNKYMSCPCNMSNRALTQDIFFCGLWVEPAALLWSVQISQGFYCKRLSKGIKTVFSNHMNIVNWALDLERSIIILVGCIKTKYVRVSKIMLLHLESGIFHPYIVTCILKHTQSTIYNYYIIVNNTCRFLYN